MDYKNGKIYELKNTENKKVFIGSTCTTLAKRLFFHRQQAHAGYQSRLGHEMRLVGCDKFYITLIEFYPCTGRDQLTSREQWYIYEKRPALNYLTYTFTTPAPVVEPKVSELLEDANDKAIISELTAKVAMLEQKLSEYEVSDYTPTEATTVEPEVDNNSDAPPVRDLFECLKGKVPGFAIRFLKQHVNEILIKGKHYKNHPKDEVNKMMLKDARDDLAREIQRMRLVMKEDHGKVDRDCNNLFETLLKHNWNDILYDLENMKYKGRGGREQRSKASVERWLKKRH